MRKTWTSTVGLAACGLFGVLLWSDSSWALPKKSTYLLCKCTCRATDAAGKHHYGSANGIWYTTSGDDCTSFHKCKVGNLEGIATDCTGKEKSATSRAPSGTLLPKGTLQPR
jgi:hypothetical protein